MTFGYLLIAAILFSCILADRFSGKFGMPALILFMAVGMIFGCDGLFKIQFDNYGVAEKVCAAALVFIMFYGGFNTKWQSAKCVAVRATILSTLGVLVTAGLTGVFCYFVLHFSYVESFLIGAVLSSTDAASVFSILRGKHLNLRDGTASLLEIESGSSTDRNRTFDKDEFYSGGIRDDLCHCDRDLLLWSGRADRGELLSERISVGNPVRKQPYPK